jgi:flagellar P-ring protein precursor FlgI
MKRIFGLYILFATLCDSLFATKVKDLANIVGVRDNQLIGYGLVVGLNGTGDGSTSVFTTQSLSNLLATVNVKIDPKDIKSKNIAAVMVTATIPPFSRQGDKVDLYVSSIGDAKSLEGGTLLLTALKGVDGRIYALGQGTISTGGFNAGGKGQKNHVTSATLRNGGLIEREIPFNIAQKDGVMLSLKQANFQNAIKIQNAINKWIGSSVAFAEDSRTIKLLKPETQSMVEFLAKVQNIVVEAEKENKIVIDEKTGTVVAGADIKIEPVVITHGDITIKVRADGAKEPEADGKNIVDMGDGTKVGIVSNIVSSPASQMTLSTLMRALQKLGAKPRDVISIIEAMKSAGAIRAELEII